MAFNSCLFESIRDLLNQASSVLGAYSQIRMLGMWVGLFNPDHIWSKIGCKGPKGVRVKVVQGRPLASLAPKLEAG